MLEMIIFILWIVFLLFIEFYILCKAYKTIKFSNLLLIKNAFFATSIMFVANELYKFVNTFNSYTTRTIKIFIEENLSTTDYQIGIFLILFIIFILIPIILAIVLVHAAVLYTQKTDLFEHNECIQKPIDFFEHDENKKVKLDPKTSARNAIIISSIIIALVLIYNIIINYNIISEI